VGELDVTNRQHCNDAGVYDVPYFDDIMIYMVYTLVVCDEVRLVNKVIFFF
jgi:hypothetical protein